MAPRYVSGYIILFLFLFLFLFCLSFIGSVDALARSTSKYMGGDDVSESYKAGQWHVGEGDQGSFYSVVYTHTPAKGRTSLNVRCVNDNLYVFLGLDEFISKSEQGVIRNIGNLVKFGIKGLPMQEYNWDRDKGNWLDQLVAPNPKTFLVCLLKHGYGKGAILVMQFGIDSTRRTLLFDVTGAPGMISDVRDHCGF